MKFIFISFIFFMQTNVMAQTVTSLMRNDSLKTHVSLPFRFANGQNEPVPIVDLKISAADVSCQVMIDPYITSNFFVKCLNPGDVTVSIYYKSNADQYIKLVYGPFTVTQLTESNAVINPVAPGADYTPGRQLFESKCIACHSAYDKPNKTASLIKSSIQSKPAMKSIILTDVEAQLISDYLSNLP